MSEEGKKALEYFYDPEFIRSLYASIDIAPYEAAKTVKPKILGGEK